MSSLAAVGVRHEEIIFSLEVEDWLIVNIYVMDLSILIEMASIGAS